MNNGREKLIKIMQTEGLNAKQFAAEVGIQAGTISNIINGRNNPSNEVIQKVLQRFEKISCDWMMLDRGPMYRPVPIAPVAEQTTPTLFDSLPAEHPTMAEPTPKPEPAESTASSSAIPSTAPTTISTAIPSTTIPTIPSSSAATSLPRRTTTTPTNAADTASAPQHTQQPVNRQEQTIFQGNNTPAKQIEKIVVFYSDGTYENFCH